MYSEGLSGGIMEQSGFSRAVGFVLALLFAAVMGACLIAVLVTEYTEPGRIMSDQARNTLKICGIAGAGAGLIAWWLQGFAAHRGFLVRAIYGFVIFMVVFCALGGLLEVISTYASNTGQHDFSPSGLYWASVGSFYTFTIFIVGSFNIGLFGVLLAPALILALVGPREIP